VRQTRLAAQQPPAPTLHPAKRPLCCCTILPKLSALKTSHIMSRFAAHTAESCSIFPNYYLHWNAGHRALTSVPGTPHVGYTCGDFRGMPEGPQSELYNRIAAPYGRHDERSAGQSPTASISPRLRVLTRALRGWR
jgi:hypothetical protein